MATKTAIKKGDDHSAKRQEPGALSKFSGGAMSTWTNFTGFLSDVRAEMRKVVTPTRKEVQATTSVVIVTVFIFGFFFLVMDSIFSSGLSGDLDISWAERSTCSIRNRDRNGRRTRIGQPEQPPVPERNALFKWYILHAYSGFERKVRESIESRVQAFGLQDKVGRVMIPTEPVTEIINGKKRTVERVFLPGYVLVEMDLDNNLWHVLKDTPKVTGFLGTGDKPVALSEEEVSSILFRSETAKDKPRMKIKFEKNEQVRITDGPFANFNGVVDEINEDRETLKVMVTIFGRSTPVELEFGKVEKIE